VENLKRGFPPETLINYSYTTAAPVVEKPTEVEYKPIPEFDRKYALLVLF
jgi:hypothetical protein